MNDLILLDFTLRKRGMKMDYRVNRLVSRGGMQMMVEQVEKSPFPPSGKVIGIVESVKPFACKVLGLWHPSFDKFLGNDGMLRKFSKSMYGEDYISMRSTLDSVEIMSVSFNGGYRFTCMVETMPGKRVKMRSPLISEDDDIFEEMDLRMGELNEEVVAFLSNTEYDVRKEARSIVERTMKPEDIEGKSDKELLLMALERVEELGGVVMYSEELEREVNEARQELPDLILKGENPDVDEVSVREEKVMAWAEGERDYDGMLAKDDEVQQDEPAEVEVISRSQESMERVDDGDRDPLADTEDWEDEVPVVVEEDEFQ